MRLRADFWVAAYIRARGVEGVDAYLRRRGDSEAGAIILKVDRLDGRAALYGLAPPSESAEAQDRRFLRLHKAEWIAPADAEARLHREIGFDTDLWIVEVEDREGRAFVNVVG
jgi:hypothetical protein